MVAFRARSTTPTRPRPGPNLGATVASANEIDPSFGPPPPDDIGVTGYFDRAVSGRELLVVRRRPERPVGRRFASTGLMRGTSHSFRVRATDGAGNSRRLAVDRQRDDDQRLHVERPVLQRFLRERRLLRHRLQRRLRLLAAWPATTAPARPSRGGHHLPRRERRLRCRPRPATGTSVKLPGGRFAPSTTCSAAAGTCDVQESRTGTSAACPGRCFPARDHRVSRGERRL